MISKELLSIILEEKVIDIILFANEYELENNIFKSLPSIYELAYMCKEWAYNQGYTIDIYNKNDGLYIEVSKHILGRYLYKSLLFDLNDEQNELIKACQWILDKDSK